MTHQSEAQLKEINKKYIIQYERMMRWYDRFEKINNGMTHDKSSNYYEDEVYAFFVNCFHLKDWLKNDDYEMYSDAEELFDKKQGILCMQICADLCNGTKHMIANKSPRLDKNTSIIKKSVTICLQEPLIISCGFGGDVKKEKQEDKPPIIIQNYKIKSNGRYFDAFDIATKCMFEWQKYLELKK